MNPERPLAPVVDLAECRRQRNEARTEIVRAANRLKVARVRYARRHVRLVEIPTARLLTMRHLNEAVAICRHWGLVDDHVLKAAGFKPVGLAKGGRVRGGLRLLREAA